MHQNVDGFWGANSNYVRDFAKAGDGPSVEKLGALRL
jgi:hypothetical protein